jgi:uncharacterized protein
MKDAKYWLEKLNLQKHPEGGAFNEVYRSEEVLDNLPDRYIGKRSVSTSIYFMLEENEISMFHRLTSDETWHFYTGCSLTVHIIDPSGKYFSVKIGSDPEKDEMFQYTIRKGCWFGAEVNDKSSYALIGCTVSPGFDFHDFELGERAKLLEVFPEHAEIIKRLTK